MPSGNAGVLIVRCAGPSSSWLTGRVVTSTTSKGHRLRIADPTSVKGGPDRSRVGWCEPPELPAPIAHEMVRDPPRGIRMAVVFPDLLQADDIGAQLVEPRNDLVPTVQPPRLHERIDVELHYPQRALTHAAQIAALRSIRRASPYFKS